MKFQCTVILFNFIFVSALAAKLKLRHEDVDVSSSLQRQQRQERRLEDQQRYYNRAYVEYKSHHVENDESSESLFEEAEELDEYVIIDDSRYQEVDDFNDADDEDEPRPSGGQLNSTHRGLVPQLWDNYTGPVLPPAESVPCNEARLKCAYRAGCGLALQNYALGCSDLVKGDTSTCNSHCRHSLIALMSTLEGQRLMKCNCTGDDFCERSKERVQPCQAEVSHATQPDTVVSCSAAQWICAADPRCSTALDYYNRFCGAMFSGKHCSLRCLNSISILRRLPAASKLETCFCDGTERFECETIKDNMERLCFGHDSDADNEVDTDGSKKSSSESMKAKLHKFLLFISFVLTIFVSFISQVVLQITDTEDSST